MRHFRLPGPVEMNPKVYQAMSQPLVGHRGPEFAELIWRVIDNLHQVYKTDNDILMLNCSGKGALEAVVANLFKPESNILVLSNGYFGDKLRTMTNRYCHSRPSLLSTAWMIKEDDVISPELVEDAVKKHLVDAIYIVHSETSTGVANPIKEIGEITRKHNKLFLVDGMSSVGGMNIPTDQWGIDVLVSASQKALGAPPGVSFVSLSKRAWWMYKRSSLPKFYWDFKIIKEFLEKGMTFSTPPISTVFGVDMALELIIEEGVDNVFKRHIRVARMLWDMLEGIGYDLFVKDSRKRSNTVTSVYVPNRMNVKDFLKILSDKFSVEFAPGLSELKDKIFRIGHMGCVTKEDMRALHGPLSHMIHCRD